MKNEDNKNASSEKSNFFRQTWWVLGIPLLIGIFAWGIFETGLRNTDFLSENFAFAFIVTSIISYLLGAAWRSKWWKVRPRCPRCKSVLFCHECDKPVFELDEEP